MSLLDTIKSLLGMGGSTSRSAGTASTESGPAPREEASSEPAAETERSEAASSEPDAGASADAGGTPLDGDAEQRGDLELTSSAFDHGGRMPDWVGYANDNDNPPLAIDGVPEDAESLALVLDDPEAEPVVGHVFDHWLVWDIDPDRGEIPRDWDGDGATVGYNDYGEAAWGGPAPPEGSHTYTFKLLALADELDAPPQTRKRRLGSMIHTNTEILAATQLEGTYDAEQGTIF